MIETIMPEKDHLILTAIGPDQVGLVEKLSKTISTHGCNIEDSKMAVFCGEFAVIVLITGNAASLAKVTRDQKAIEQETGLSIAIKTPVTRKPSEAAIPYRLTASCMDHPGVVSEISGVLSNLGVNIESMETRTYFAPITNTPLFQLDATLSVPSRTDIHRLRDLLEEIQREQYIDIELTAFKA
jgi:glycine cleavage system transcriptional repressor